MKEGGRNEEVLRWPTRSEWGNKNTKTESHEHSAQIGEESGDGKKESDERVTFFLS